MRQMMGRLKLTVNEEKTRICRVPDGEFDFLGYTFGRRYSAKTGRSYIASRPSRKSIKRMTEAVRIQTGRNMEWLDAGEMVKCLNQKLGGWANYFNPWSGYTCIPIHRQVHHKPASPAVLQEA
jgi:RNA-directed DNA polymerase